jgi:hypothetical protein
MKKLFSFLAGLLFFALPAVAVDNGCSLALQVYGSPYQGTPNNLLNTTNNMYTVPNCTSAWGVGHTDSAGNNKLVNDPPGIFLIGDGDLILVTWPDCVSSGWGVAAAGMLYTIDQGQLIAQNRITLSIPSWNNLIPTPIVNPPTGALGGPVGLPGTQIPPFSQLGIPPFGLNPADVIGYNGAVWRCHISCGDCQHVVHCTASFEVVEISGSMNPAWVFNSGTGFPGIINGVIPRPTGYYTPPDDGYTGPHPVTISGGLQYQW